MGIAKQIASCFVAAALLLNGVRSISAQPLLRESPPENGQEADSQPDAAEEAARRRALAAQEQRLKVQEELMRIRGEQMQAEREEQERTDRFMRYALLIAVTVIAVTLLVAYARSRDESGDGPPKP